MTQREKLCARIRALLAKTVANGCTEEEAIEAARKAAELLAKYNITLDEAQMRESPFAKHSERRDDTVGERLWKVAVAISELTGARYWTAPHGMVSEITFFGFEHEVLVAKYLLDICGGAMRRHERLLRKKNQLLTASAQRRHILPFLDGMADRLAMRIRALKPPKPTGTGLVVLHQALIDAALIEAGHQLVERPVRRGSRNLDIDYLAGINAADNVALNPGVTTADKSGLRLR